MDIANVNFALYQGKDEYKGLVEVQLPEVSKIAAEIKGAGIGGTYSAPIPGHYEGMTLILTNRNVRKDQFKAMKVGTQQFDLRQALSERDEVTGEIKTTKIKHIFRTEAVKHTQGKVAAASTMDGSQEHSVSYWATYINGEKTQEIDIFNMIAFVNGTDELAEVRAALGK